MSKLSRIGTFISVIEENGFAAAAKKKGVSTPAISRQILALETELNTQLIKRNTRHISLTEVGYEYYGHCKMAIEKLLEAENAISHSQDQAIGTLTILSNPYFALSYIVPRLSDFLKQNPGLKINLKLEERFPNLDKEDIDIVFGMSLEGSIDLVRKRFASTRYVLCASPTYLEQYGIPKNLEELASHHYITHSMRQPEDVIEFKGDKRIYISPVLRLNNTFAMKECALQHLGIVNLHYYMVEQDLREKKLIEILEEFQIPEMNIYLYYRPSRYLHPKIRRFIDFFTG